MYCSFCFFCASTILSSAALKICCCFWMSFSRTSSISADWRDSKISSILARSPSFSASNGKRGSRLNIIRNGVTFVVLWVLVFVANTAASRYWPQSSIWSVISFESDLKKNWCSAISFQLQCYCHYIHTQQSSSVLYMTHRTQNWPLQCLVGTFIKTVGLGMVGCSDPHRHTETLLKDIIQLWTEIYVKQLPYYIGEIMSCTGIFEWL